MVLDPRFIHRPRPEPFHRETPLPQGMDIPNEIQRPAAPFNPQPIQNHIRGLIQRLRGQVPTPADRPPQEAPPMAPPAPKSVLIR